MKKIIVLLLLVGGCTWTTYRQPYPPPAPQDCYDFEDQTVVYESNSPEECRGLLFRCESYEERFFDECGCGCKIIEGIDGSKINF